MNIIENIRIALRSIKSNLLRSILTIIIITVGITSLVGILTAIDVIIYSLNNNFNQVGANTFSIHQKYQNLHSRRSGKSPKKIEVIGFRDAESFKEKYDFPGARTAVHSSCTNNAVIKYKNESTNPTVSLTGIDDNFFNTAGYEIEFGRHFSVQELQSGAPKVIIGYDIVKHLFDKNPQIALQKTINIEGKNYVVVGVLKEKGSGGNTRFDRNVFIPLMNAKRYYHYADKRYNIDVNIIDATQMENAISQATGLFRNIRKLKAAEDNDFEIRKSDSLMSMIKDATFKIRAATIAISLITLLGASIGLMNIMLVTVTERTREVGIRKAMGATRKNILVQFLTEAVVIGQIGGLAGIVLGMVAGVVIAIKIDGPFQIPWMWIILGFLVNMIVGIISGIYPALKASKMDPIESLRYE